MNGTSVPIAPAQPSAETAARPLRRKFWRLRNVALILAAVPLAGFGLSVLLTPPLEPISDAKALPPPELSKAEAATAKLASLTWPEQRLDGAQAKELLLQVVSAAQERMEAVEGYTAILRRQERINNRLGTEQTIQLKVRNRPFGVYMRFVNPDAGKEAVYSEGRYDNHIMAHGGGLTRAILPRLKVPTDSPLAMSGNRHPITDAGLLNLTRKLVHFRKLDLEDDDAGTVLDRLTDAEGRSWLRSIHTHTIQNDERPFMYVEVFYDPETKLPIRIESYEWPKKGDKAGKPVLGERYRYDDLVLDAPLTDLDFDPANPDYEFHRF